MKVFADTSALFAVLVRNDRLHEHAGGILRRLLVSEDELHTSSYILAETHALLQSRSGLEAVMAFERLIRPELMVHWVDEKLHAKAFRRLASLRRRSVGIVDCTSFEVMTHLGIDHVFGFDHHFAEQGFTLLEG